MYEVHHSVEDLEIGNEILWNGREYTVTAISESVVELSDFHKLKVKTVDQWFKNKDVPFEIKL